MTVIAVDTGVVWVFWSGVALAAAGLTLAAWALTWDWLKGRRGPGRTRRRCPRCWYDMRGASGLLCPECGHTATGERRLHRSRRRWPAAVLGLLVILAGAAGVNNTYLLRTEWIPWLPSWLLVSMLDDPTLPPPGQTKGTARQQAVREEVWRRYTAGALSRRSRAVVAVAQFSRGATPALIHSRPAWPSGDPVWVEIHGRFGGPLPRELTLTPLFDGGRPISAYHGGYIREVAWERAVWSSGPSHDGGLQCIGTPPPGATIAFRAAITESGETIWTGVLEEHISVGGTLEQVLPPADSPAADAALLAAAGQGRLSIDPDAALLTLARPTDPALADLTIGALVEVLEGETVIVSAQMVWTSVTQDEQTKQRSWSQRSPEPLIIRPLTGDLARLRQLDPAAGRCRIRIRGDGALALTDLDGTRWWRGELTLPLNKDWAAAAP